MEIKTFFKTNGNEKIDQFDVELDLKKMWQKVVKYGILESF
jgi:hypothetical protein